jgi:hypothetical protein
MSTVGMHAPFTHYSGTIGKLVYRKYRGRTIVSVKPDADRPLSQAEVAHRQDFAQAAAWAKAALQDDELRPFYEALGKQRDIPAPRPARRSRGGRAAAVSDFLKRPTLEALDLAEYTGQAGDPIYFMASDNAGLVDTMVEIGDGNGTVFESGAAVEVDEGTCYWMYTAQSALPAGTPIAVNVKVVDRPGNIVEVSEEKAL